MSINSKYLQFGGQKILTILVMAGFLISFLPISEPETQKEGVDFEIEEILESLGEGLVIVQKNSLLPISGSLSRESQEIKKIKVVVTGYSSSTWETDDSPYITAAGTWVRDGIVANNLLPFGTKIKLPELYGDKIFIVEDRMNSKKGYYHIDIWFSSYWEAKSFGAKTTYIKILEN